MINMKLIIEIDDEIYNRVKGIHGKGSYYEEIIKNGTIVEPMKGTVSREAVLDVVRENAHHLDWQITAINLLPNVEPQQEPKTGHWIRRGHDIYCSECKAMALSPSYWECDLEASNYCPNCRAQMERVIR